MYFWYMLYSCCIMCTIVFVAVWVPIHAHLLLLKEKGEDRLVVGESFCGEKQIKFSSIFGVPWTSRDDIFWQSAAAGMLQSNLMPAGTYGSECTLLQNWVTITNWLGLQIIKQDEYVLCFLICLISWKRNICIYSYIQLNIQLLYICCETRPEAVIHSNFLVFSNSCAPLPVYKANVNPS